MSIMRSTLAGTLLGLILITGGALQPAQAADHNVSIGDNFFDPATTTVQRGDTVIWTHQGLNPHTVTFANNGPNSGALSSGQSFSVSFTSVGQFDYFCLIHAGMEGTVIVQGEALPARAWLPLVVRD